MNTIVQKQDETVAKPRTRCGYVPSECLKSFEKALSENGAVASGRCIHFAADMICSGAIDIFLTAIWKYAICHVGIGSPRIFVYLKKRISELMDTVRRLPEEDGYKSEELQVRAGEMILVLREAPSRGMVAWPKVGAETHSDTWIRAATGATETSALLRVWKSGGDMPILRLVGAELCRAISDGSTAKALFWVKWLFEEENKVKKETKGAVLSTVGRGSSGSKVKSGVGFYILALYAELYKEMAAKETVRMHEEFQCLLDLWRTSDPRINGVSRRQILVILTQILCDVPRWKVPAAPQLIKDPLVISRAAGQVPKFFREVLLFDPIKITGITKLFKSNKDIRSEKEKKGDASMTQLEAFDKALEDYYNRM
jgi:hypothetical protein